MQAADEKLIINKLGHCYTSSGHGITSQVYQGRWNRGGRVCKRRIREIISIRQNLVICQSREALTLSLNKVVLLVNSKEPNARERTLYDCTCSQGSATHAHLGGGASSGLPVCSFLCRG